MTRPECIFCKSATTSFTSVEHIVPESLGNTEHVLPLGIVCDHCNNYFARKVEQPILGSEYFSHARHRNGVASKRRRIPEIKAITFPQGIPIDLGVDRDGSRYVASRHVRDHDRFCRMFYMRERFSAIFPVAEPPDRRLFARFLIAIGMKAAALRMLQVPGGIHVDLVHNRCFDEARGFARYGTGPRDWPYHELRLYAEDHVFTDETDGTPYHVSHAYTLLYTGELYFVIALFGIQYTINLGGPELDGFYRWLGENGHQSPLYPAEG